MKNVLFGVVGFSLLFGGCLGGCRASGERSLEEWSQQVATVSEIAKEHGATVIAQANWNGKLFEFTAGGFAIRTGVAAEIRVTAGGPAQVAHEMMQYIMGQQAMNDQRLRRIEDVGLFSGPPVVPAPPG